MKDILNLFIAATLLTIMLSAYFLTFTALFSERVARTQRICTQSAARSFWVGLVNFVFFGMIVLVLFSIAENAENFVRFILLPPAVVIGAVLAILLSFGLTGMSNTLGERLFAEQPAWRKTLFGTILLAFACALPVVGWFLLFPYAGLVGFGAVILGFLQRENKS